MVPPSSDLLTVITTPPEGFALIKNAVPEESWKILQTWLETDRWDDGNDVCPIPWQMGAQNRRVAQFGFQYDYVNDRVDTKSPTPPIPQRLKELLHIEPHFSQYIINEYGPNVLIPWHMDDLEFGVEMTR